VHEPAVHLDPELRHVLAARPEVAKDALDDVHARRRVAMLHEPPDDRQRAGEHAVLPFAEELDAIVGADQREVDRQDREEAFQVLERQRSRRQHDRPGAERLDRLRRPRREIGHAQQRRALARGERDAGA